MIYFLISILACNDIDIESTIEIPKEAYDWKCYDRVEYTLVSITAGVCNELESMTVNMLLLKEETYEFNMKHDGGCWWSTEFEIQEYCIEIEELILIGEIK